MNPNCRECGGASFTFSSGLKICDQCGSQQQGYVELLSQEIMSEVDRSRLTHVRKESELAAEAPQEEGKLNNWTSYEAFNTVLYEWTRALRSLGASQQLERVVFKLWVAYLQRMEIAFRPPGRAPKPHRPAKATAVPNRRDLQLIHKGARSVSSASLRVSYRRRKKVKTTKSNLEKLKSKIERKKLKASIHHKEESSFLSSSLAHELSKSLTEYEAALSDSCTGTSLNNEESDTQVTSKEGVSSMSGDSGWQDSRSSGQGSARGGEGLLSTPRKWVCRNKIVSKWVEKCTKIYDSDNSDREDEYSCQEGSDEEESDVCAPSVSSRVSRVSRATSRSSAPSYRRAYKRSVKIVSRQTRWRRAILPLHMNFQKLLGLLYLAVLMAEEDILLMDIIRWCREGHIPYLSAHYLLRQDIELYHYDLYMMKSAKKIPTAEELQHITGNLALFLSVQYVPLPSPAGIITKIVQLLHLPESVGTIAKLIINQEENAASKFAVPPNESMAMASIILALKIHCGLDGNTELHLSHVAATINSELQQWASTTTLFSWQDWQRHTSRLLWLCCQVDPASALHCHQHHHSHFNSELFSKFFWSEEVWRIPRTSTRKTTNKVVQSLNDELLQHQGETLGRLLNQPHLFQPTQQPFLGIVKQLLQMHNGDKMEVYRKIGEEILRKSFTSHCFDWTGKVGTLQTELRQHGSRWKLRMPTVLRGDSWKILGECSKTYKKNEASSHQQVLGQRERISEEETRGNTRKTLMVPLPAKHVWELQCNARSKWKDLASTLPASFRWLVGLGSLICETSEMQLLFCVKKLESHIRRRRRRRT